ncbi:hypothetical protein MHY1_02354 [Methylovirgula sp. HY1]|nr:hypothetical protein MHY1_02354 [Methylovirgula sp. HY1]
MEGSVEDFPALSFYVFYRWALLLLTFSYLKNAFPV